MQLVDPIVASNAEGGRLAPRLLTFDAATIGLWSNQKLNADALLSHVEQELRARWQLGRVVHGTYHPARVMQPTEWGALDECDAVILTHGD
jgi:hypothetical protein